MSRIKKSRKPGLGSSGARKPEKEVVAVKEKRIRKKTGNTPGSRQQVAKKNEQTNANSTVKDPRIGSKKPIVLIKSDTPKQPVAKAKKSAPAEIASIRTVTPVISNDDLRDELQAIENDELLQDIIDKQEQELELSETEVAHYNQLMERHQSISEQLGIVEEDDETDDIVDAPLSEEALWDKFNATDFDEES